MTKITFRVEGDFKDRLDEVCKFLDLTHAEVMMDCIYDGLDELEIAIEHRKKNKKPHLTIVK